MAGGFFRLNYAFKDRYLLEVNGRYDGSSKFPTDQQWAFFPSVSGGWRVSEEAFWKVNPELFSNLKIRASYGSLGNGNVSPYSFLELLSISTSGRVLNGLKNKYTSAPAVMPDGLTWETGRRILSGTDPKPENPAGQGESYGLGDGCVVWNDARKVWICYYSGYCDDPGNYMITMACSEDPAGAAGTWKKWDGKAFTVEGCNGQTQLGGANIKIANLDTYAGGNPSVMWNHYIGKWVMVYHSWSRRICLSTSADGIAWEAPISLNLGEEEAMYPNLISEEGDQTGGQAVRMYYAADMNDLGQRSLAWRKVVFY